MLVNIPMETILNSMTEGVLVTDEKSRILLVNPSLRAILNLEENCVGKRLLECLRNPQIYEAIEGVLNTGARQEKEVTLPLNGEEKNLMVHSAPLISASQIVGTVSVFNDVTLLRRLEKIRSEFVANISHELKTPLTHIRGFAETLKSGALQDPRVASSFLEKIENSAIQLQQLVEDILKLSEIESGRMDLRPADFLFNDLVDKLRENFSQRLLAKNLQWIADIPPGFQVKTDWGALQQILMNLIDNAVKYTPEGGRITVAARSGANGWDASVSDTGIGISAEDLPRIFERFYRADKSRSRETQGTGLGLAIVKHLAQTLGGEVLAESQPGAGSRFLLKFPNRHQNATKDFYESERKGG